MNLFCGIPIRLQPERIFIMNKMPYKLRCSMPGHSKDVRSVTVGDLMEECIVSGSRDKTAKLWLPEGYTN